MGFLLPAAVIGAEVAGSGATAAAMTAVGEGAMLASSVTGAALAPAAATAATAGGTSLASLAAYSSLAASGLGAVTSMVGAGQAAGANSAYAAYNAQVAENNRLISEQNSKMASAVGNQQATIEGEKTRATVGAIKAQQAASNIDVNKGSAVDVRSSAAELGELNALTVRSNAARAAYGYDVQASGAAGQAGLDRAMAGNAANAGTTTQISSLLAGASSLGSQYATGKRLGLLG